MKKSLELLRDKLSNQGWTKEASRVNTLVKWARAVHVEEGQYGLDNGATVKYDPKGGAKITIVGQDTLGKYPKDTTYQQGASGDEGKNFDVLYLMIKKKIEKTP